MASLVKLYDRQKTMGQVYTPNFLVTKILDNVGYDDESILGKYILDPACGDGQFLKEIARRIIDRSSLGDLATNLKCLVGWDVDPVAVQLCRKSLDALIEPYGIVVDWNIHVQDSLRILQRGDFETNYRGKFDFVVGNPPYVRVQHMEMSYRSFLQNWYHFCRYGSTDVFIAFFELALHLIGKQGKCGFVTPNSFLYTRTAGRLRDFLASQRLVNRISNYGSHQLFDDATTYSAITILSHENADTFIYEEAFTRFDFLTARISYNTLRPGFSWKLSTSNALLKEGVRLGDVVKIQVGLTTLCDKAYIFKVKDYDDRYVIAYTKFKGERLIEREILRPIIKASKFKTSDQQNEEFVLFPYQKEDGNCKIIPEKDLASRFPKAYKYLCDVKDILNKRDNGRPNAVAWYAFGRNQGLNIPSGPKIIFSSISREPLFVLCNDMDALFYAGYCMFYQGDYMALLPEINSARMADYISIASRDFRGGWKAYNKTVVDEFIIESQAFTNH